MLITKNKLVKNASKILEEELNIKLPEDYKKFLDKYNGGVTYNTKVKVGSRWQEVDGFNGVGDVNKNYSFNRMRTMGVLENYLKKQFLPIANNLSGDYYCLYLGSDDYGAIYLVYHDLLGKKKRIYSSFFEFIEIMKSDLIGYIPTIEEREATAIANGYTDMLDDLRPIWKEEIEKFSNLVQEEVILD